MAIKVILFDWGDTLMRDDSTQIGKMYLWPDVAAIPHAEQTLRQLHDDYQIYVATNANDSNPQDIERALARVELDLYIDGYFCRQNVGTTKDDPAFYQTISEQLDIAPCEILMVGDTLETDIYSARNAGLQTVWYNRLQSTLPDIDTRTITSLEMLPDLLNIFDLADN
jgi:putative hydrolase of the HAD superfamily